MLPQDLGRNAILPHDLRVILSHGRIIILSHDRSAGISFLRTIYQSEHHFTKRYASQVNFGQGSTPKVFGNGVRCRRSRLASVGGGDALEIGILLPNNQRQHCTLHIQKDVLPYAFC